MNIKKIFLIGVIILTAGCGYQSMYVLSEGANFSINKILQDGNKNINRKIISRINIKQKKTAISYDLSINSEKIKQTSSKDKYGNVALEEILLKVKIVLNYPNNLKLIKEKEFTSSFIYNSQGSKFELTQFLKIKEADLIDKIVNDIMIFLNS